MEITTQSNIHDWNKLRQVETDLDNQKNVILCTEKLNTADVISVIISLK